MQGVFYAYARLHLSGFFLAQTCLFNATGCKPAILHVKINYVDFTRLTLLEDKFSPKMLGEGMGCLRTGQNKSIICQIYYCIFHIKEKTFVALFIKSCKMNVLQNHTVFSAPDFDTMVEFLSEICRWVGSALKWGEISTHYVLLGIRKPHFHLRC